jgi:hypothetical protein
MIFGSIILQNKRKNKWKNKESIVVKRKKRKDSGVRGGRE